MNIDGKLDRQALHRRFGKGFKGISLQISSEYEDLRQNRDFNLDFD